MDDVGAEERAERDRIRRIGEQGQRQRAAARDRAVSDRLAWEAQEERDRKMDRSFDQEGLAMFGELISDIEQDLNRYKGPSDADIAAAAAAIRDARKAAAGGWLSRPDPGKANKILKKNQGAIKKARKKTGSGCLMSLVVMAMVSAAVLGGAVYGAVEAIAAVVN